MSSDRKITEDIQYNDLVDLIDPVISIDQYKSKIDDDENIVVIAFKIKDRDPARDLSQFIETGHDALDVDISPGPDEDGKYTVFVELKRQHGLYDSIERILRDVQQVDTDIDSWKFTSYENNKLQTWSKQAFESSVITSSYEYVIKHNPDAKAIAERMKFLKDY
jgi:hypothetical protein